MPPRLARLLAAVVAIALVAGAFALRGTLSDDEDTAPRPGSAGSDGETDDAFGVACDEDLGRACDALEEVLGYAVDRVTAQDVLTSETLDWDAWLTLDPMPAVLDARRELAGETPLTEGLVSVAAAGLSLLEIEGAVACEEVDWSCLVDAAGSEEIGLPALDGSTGLVMASSALLALVPDIDDVGLRNQEDALADLEVLFERTGDLQDQHVTMVTARGTYSGIVTTTPLADRQAEHRGTEGFVARPLMPEVTVGVVLAGLGGGGAEAVRALGDALTDQTVRDALTEAGWEGEPGASSGLPDFDVIYALQERLTR